MESIKITARTDHEGNLNLKVPAGLVDQVYEVIVVLNPVPDDKAVDDLGWPIGFFERTYGALADDPIERGAE